VTKNHWKRRVIRGAWILGGIAGAWLFFRYGFRWLGPFLLAFATAALLERPTAWLVRKRKWKRGFASAVCTLLFFTVLTGGAGGLFWVVFSQAEALFADLPGMLESLWASVEALREKADGLMDGLPEALRRAVDSGLAGFTEKLSEIPGTLARKVPEAAAGIVRAAPGVLLFLVTYGAGTFFLGAGFPAVRRFLALQIPQRVKQRLSCVKGEAAAAVGTWLSAQLRLMLVTFLEMAAGFWLLRIEYAALLAALVALVDALPVLGTGVVLLPWAVGELLLGSPVRALALTLLYAAAALVRSFLEPRLIGSGAGVHPAASLFAVYSGFCLAGVGGMIVFPILLLVAKQLSDKGYIRLWRKEEKNGGFYK